MPLVPQVAPQEYHGPAEGRFRADFARQVEDLVRRGNESVLTEDVDTIEVGDTYGDSVTASTLTFDPTFEVTEGTGDGEAVVSYGPATTTDAVSGDFALDANAGPTRVLMLSGNATLTGISNLSSPLQVLVIRDLNSFDLGEDFIVPVDLDLSAESEYIVLSFHRFADNIIAAAGFNADSMGTLGSPIRLRPWSDTMGMAATRAAVPGSIVPITAPTRAAAIAMAEAWTRLASDRAAIVQPFSDALALATTRAAVLGDPPGVTAPTRAAAISMSETWTQSAEEVTEQTFSVTGTASTNVMNMIFTPGELFFDNLTDGGDGYLRRIRLAKSVSEVILLIDVSRNSDGTGGGRDLVSVLEDKQFSSLTLTDGTNVLSLPGPANHSWTSRDNSANYIARVTKSGGLALYNRVSNWLNSIGGSQLANVDLSATFNIEAAQTFTVTGTLQSSDQTWYFGAGNANSGVLIDSVLSSSNAVSYLRLFALTKSNQGDIRLQLQTAVSLSRTQGVSSTQDPDLHSDLVNSAAAFVITSGSNVLTLPGPKQLPMGQHHRQHGAVPVPAMDSGSDLYDESRRVHRLPPTPTRMSCRP